MFYDQISGCPIKGSLSSYFAEIVFLDLESQCLSKLYFKPVYYCNYMKEIFCIIQLVTVLENLLARCILINFAKR